MECYSQEPGSACHHSQDDFSEVADDREWQDALAVKAIVPEKVQHDGRERIAIIFNHRLKVKTKEQFFVDFVGTTGAVLVSATRANSSTLVLKTPVHKEPSVVTAYVYQGNRRRLLGQHRFEFLSRNDTIYRLLHEEPDPINFMCESLGIASGDIRDMDIALAETFVANAPQGFDFLGHHRQEKGQSSAEYPTLLHFASKFGLTKLIEVILRYPGAFEACSMKNYRGQWPYNIAENHGYDQLANCLRVFYDRGDPDGYIKMGNDGGEVFVKMQKEDGSYCYVLRKEGNELYTDVNNQDGQEECYVKMVKAGGGYYYMPMKPGVGPEQSGDRNKKQYINVQEQDESAAYQEEFCENVNKTAADSNDDHDAQEIYEDMERNENAHGDHEELYVDMEPDADRHAEEELYMPMDQAGKETSEELYTDMLPAEEDPLDLYMSMDLEQIPDKFGYVTAKSIRPVTPDAVLFNRSASSAAEVRAKLLEKIHRQTQSLPVGVSHLDVLGNAFQQSLKSATSSTCSSTSSSGISLSSEPERPSSPVPLRNRRQKDTFTATSSTCSSSSVSSGISLSSEPERPSSPVPPRNSRRKDTFTAGMGSKLQSKEQLSEKQLPGRLSQNMLESASARATRRPIPKPTRRLLSNFPSDTSRPPAHQIIRQNPSPRLIGDLPFNVKDNLPCKDTSILSKTFTCEGGVVVTGSVKLVCPPGAVDNPVSVNIILEDPSKYYGLIVQKDLENDFVFAAPIINLEPSAYIFNKRLTLVSKFKVENLKWDDLVILHGSRARDRKINWQDITYNSRIDKENAEVIIEIEHFSLVAILARLSRSTVIRTKEIVSRLNLLAFNYTLSVLLNKSGPSVVYDELALLFVSQDVYCEQFYREDETFSAFMQLKKEGFVELHARSVTGQEEKSIYNNENLQINVHLGEDYKLADRQKEKTSFTVQSYVWWNAGMVIRLPLEWKKDVRSLCGKISVQGEYGHTSEICFSEQDLCGYVRSLLGVREAIFNLIPIGQLLEMPEESMSQVTTCFRDEDQQLGFILQHWSETNDVVEDLAALRKKLESLQQEDYMITKRGQMHIRHLRKLATKISGLQCENADSVNYFVRKIQTLCKSVLSDCYIELEGSIEDVYRAASSASYAEFLIHSIEIHRPLPEDIARKYQQVCSSSEKAIIKTFLIVVPHLIQSIKDIFVIEKISEVPQNGLTGLPKEELDDFVSRIRNAEEHNRSHELVYESCNILEQLCLKNDDKLPTAEIKIWGDTVGIHAMLNFLKRFFQHCRQDIGLHKRLDLFSRRQRDIMANHEDIDEVFVHDLANLLLSLIHFAKFDPSKLVKFRLNDSADFSLTSPSEKVMYDKHEHTYSQVFRIKKESEGQLRLHAIAHVYINGKICEKGALQSEIRLKASSEEAFHGCSNHLEDVAVVKLEDNDPENLRVILCATQKEKLSELQDFLKQELRENVDLNQSEVTQCQLTIRTVTTMAGAVVNLRLVYKWGSEAVVLDSKDFVQVVDLSKERIVLDQHLTLTAEKQPEGGSTIRENNVASRDMQISIKMMNGEKNEFTVKPNDSIKDVKKKVQQLNVCPLDRQRLVFAGKKLDDDHTLSDYNVQNGSTLCFVQRLRDAPVEDAS